MQLAIQNLELLLNGELPNDTMCGDSYRQLFCTAKPLIDYAFKVEKPGYLRVYCFDRYLPGVIDLRTVGHRLRVGQFYPLGCLLSGSDLSVAYYLYELGWQTLVTVRSIKHLEYAVLAIFQAETAFLRESEEYRLHSMEEEAVWPEMEMLPARLA